MQPTQVRIVSIPVSSL